jgi:hypothetical protein
MLAVMVISTPEAFGLNSVILNYLAVINVGIGVLLNQLKALGQSSRQIETVTAVREVQGRAPAVTTVTTERTTGKTDEKSP